MSWGDPDVYYQPEHFGLTQIAEIDLSSGCYEFDLRVVWCRTDGALVTARDSGCSCPSPFEDFTSLDDLEPLDLVALRRELQTEDDYASAADRQRFLGLVSAAARNSGIRTT